MFSAPVPFISDGGSLMSEKYPERNARIRALRGTMTYAEIAKEVGVSPHVVGTLFWRDDHKWHRPKRELDRTLADAARRAGLTVQDIRAIARERRAQ
jgi:uncharacterized protein YjcR